MAAHSIGAFAVMGYSFFMTLIIGYLLHLILGFRISEEEELAGIDVASHAESAYELTTIGSPLSRHSGSGGGGSPGTPAPAFAGSSSSAPPRSTPNASESPGTRVDR